MIKTQVLFRCGTALGDVHTSKHKIAPVKHACAALVAGIHAYRASMPTPAALATGFLGSFCGTVLGLRWYVRGAYPYELRALCLCLMLLSLLWLLWPKHRCSAAVVAAVCLGAFLAFARVPSAQHVPGILDIDSYAGRVTVTGQIVAQPERSADSVRYTLAVHALSGSSLPVEGRLLMRTRNTWPRHRYGDCLTVRGTVERPKGDGDFRYDNYLAIFGIHALLQEGLILEKTEAKNVRTPWTQQGCTIGPWARLQRELIATKEWFEGKINRLLPEPTASLAAGILTGTRRSIPEDVLEAFKVTGLSHVIAISGFNITIIVTLIGQMLFFLPLRFRLLPAVTAIVLFTVFVGASAAVVRAAVMGCLGLLAVHLGRMSQARLTVLWTLAMMTLWNPLSLWYDAGFQLSFLAVVGLMEIRPRLEPFFRRLPEALGIRESLQMTVAAQITTAPLLAVVFGRVSLIAPLANLLVAPAIPVSMFMGFLATCAGFLCEPLGLLLAYPTWALLSWVIFVAETLSLVPFASI